MRRVIRCPACSSCARVAGRAFGERGEPGAGVVPLDVEVGQYKPGTPGEEW